LRQGITFNVYQDEQGLERAIPVDLVPRIIDVLEWSTIEAGLKQRVHALNLFVHDIDHEQRILRQGVLPLDVVLGAAEYRPELRGIWQTPMDSGSENLQRVRGLPPAATKRPYRVARCRRVLAARPRVSALGDVLH
jgi:A circularly permuted ATPgrasp